MLDQIIQISNILGATIFLVSLVTFTAKIYSENLTRFKLYVVLYIPIFTKNQNIFGMI